MKELQGKVMSVGEHHRDDEESHGVYVEVSKEQLRARGVGFLYREVRVEIVDPRPAISAAEAEQTLRAKTQPPSACPFCGAARKPACRFEWFQCGTMTAPGDNNRRDQTPTCATAERSRLTRERDEAREYMAQMTFEAAEAQLKHEAAVKELDTLRARVKRLEEAGDRLRKYLRIAVGPDATGWETPHGVNIGKRIEAAITSWTKAKETKP
jgi:hypothetical protein